jgi:hypothetical protein
MKRQKKSSGASPGRRLVTELLILPDGRILVHNLTPAFAGLLHELNPDAEQISSRLSRRNEVKADVIRPRRHPMHPAARQRRPTGFKAQSRNRKNVL